jgi:hypothetical protein
VTQAFHQSVGGKPTIRLFMQISRQGAGLGQYILTGGNAAQNWRI